MKKTITFIGAGNMSEALISGFLKSGLVTKGNITAVDIKRPRLAYLRKRYGIKVDSDKIGAVRRAGIIFLGVKPGQVRQVLCEISQYINKSQLVISFAAGIQTKFIEKFLPAGTPVIRSMPNMPALVGEGAIAVSKGKFAKSGQLNIAVKFFSSVGKVIKIEERYMDAVTALSGSGPAYVFYLAEAIEKAGEALGLSKNAAELLSGQTIYGAGKLMKESGIHPKELRSRVTSKGGTTEAAIKHFEKEEVFAIVREALKSARKRAGELSLSR